MPPATTGSRSESLYVGLIIFFGIVLGYLMYSSDFLPLPPQKPTAQIARDDFLTKMGSIRLDFSVFENISFRQLKIFGEIPVKPGETGRDNPFAPF